MADDRSVARPYRVPLLLAVASVVGLLMALVGDGLWNVVAWVLLAAPVLAVAWAIRAAMRARSRSPGVDEIQSSNQGDQQER